MKINLEKTSEYGNFSIEPTAGKQIPAVYFDFAAKLLIVEELADSNKSERSEPIYVTTIDAAARKIIPPDERKNYIDYSEASKIEEEPGLKRIFGE